MRSLFIFDVTHFRFGLEEHILDLLDTTSLSEHVDTDVSSEAIFQWWLANRLDHVCLYPILHDQTPVISPALKQNVLQAGKRYERLLYRSFTPEPRRDVEWVRATIRLKGQDLYLELHGNSSIREGQ